MKASIRMFAIALLLVLPVAATARPPGTSAAEQLLTDRSLELVPSIDFNRATLELVGPNGQKSRKYFDSGEPIQLGLFTETGEPMPDGRYNYFLRLLVPGRGGAITKNGLFFIAEGRAVDRSAGDLVPLRNQSIGPSTQLTTVDDALYVFDLETNGRTILGLQSFSYSPTYGSTDFGWQSFHNEYGVAHFKYFSGDFETQTTTMSITPGGNVGIGTFPATTTTLSVYGATVLDGDVTMGSSRALKTGFAPVEASEILSKLVELPLQKWSFKRDERRAMHLGPMAEDFFASFGLGSDAEHLSPVDTAGVAFAAIQALNSELQRLRDENDEIRARLHFAILLTVMGLVAGTLVVAQRVL